MVIQCQRLGCPHLMITHVYYKRRCLLGCSGQFVHKRIRIDPWRLNLMGVRPLFAQTLNFGNPIRSVLPLHLGSQINQAGEKWAQMCDDRFASLQAIIDLAHVNIHVINDAPGLESSYRRAGLANIKPAAKN